MWLIHIKSRSSPATHPESHFSLSIRCRPGLFSWSIELWIKQLVICSTICLLSFLPPFHCSVLISSPSCFFRRIFGRCWRRGRITSTGCCRRTDATLTPHFNYFMWLSQFMFAFLLLWLKSRIQCVESAELGLVLWWTCSPSVLPDHLEGQQAAISNLLLVVFLQDSFRRAIKCSPLFVYTCTRQNLKCVIYRLHFYLLNIAN